MKTSKTRLNILIMAGFLILPFLFFGSVTVGPKTMLPVDNLFQWSPWASYAAAFGIEHPQNHLLSDLILQNYAWKHFVQESLQQRTIPLWNPYLFAGVPFLAAGQHGAYYPLGLMFLALPLAKAYGWYTVLQLWLAGLFTYFLGRVLGQRRGSAFLSGLVFQSCGFMLVSAAVFPMIIGAAIWLPLLLACLELVIQRAADETNAGRTLPWVVTGAIALGCQVLAGHIEITYYTLLVMAAFSLWRLAGPLRRIWRSDVALRRRLWAMLKPPAWLLSLVALGLMLGAVQFLPFAEVGQTNFREGSATLAEVRGWAFPPRRLLTLSLPNFFGNPSHHDYVDVFSGQRLPFTLNSYGQPNPNGAQSSDWGIKNYVEGGIYLGIFPLLLAILGVWAARGRPAPGDRGRRWRQRRSHIGFLTILSLASLAFIFGTPLYAVLYYGLPGINQLHSPFRWVFPLSVAVAVLAGFGADYVQLQFRAAAPASIVRWLGRLAVAAALCLLLGLAASWLLYPSLEPTIERVFMGLALAPSAFPTARAFYSYEFWQLLALAAALLAGGGLLWFGPRLARAHRFLWLAAAAVLIGADLYVASAGFHAANPPELLDFQPQLLQWLAAQPGPWRFTTFDPHGEKPLNANAGWPYQLQDVRGYESVIPKQYTEYMGTIESQKELPFNRVQPIVHWESLNSPLLDLLGVKYIVTTQTLELPKLALAWQGEGLRVYENLAAVPRAFTLPRSATVVAPNPLVSLAQYDPRAYVHLAAADAAALGLSANDSPAQPGDLTPAAIKAYGSLEVTVRATAAAPAWLVLNDSFAPGWDVFVRPVTAAETGELLPAQSETKTSIVRVNGNFRGVPLEAGTWEVRFRYSPLSFKLGGLTSFMGGIILLFGLAVWAWRQFFPQRGELTNTRSIARNSLAPMVLNLFNRAIDFVFAAFYLRLLGPGDAGSYATAITIASLYEIIANWGLNTLIIREVSQDKSQASRYLLNTSVLRLGTGLVGSLPVVLYLLGRAVGGNPLDAATQWAILLLMAGMIFSGMGQGLTGLFYAYEQAEMPAAVTTVTTILKVAFGVLVLLLGWGFVGLAGVSILVNLVTLAILLIAAVRQFHLPGPWRVDLGLQRQMLSASYPLMLNHLLATVFFLVDVPLLQQFKGDEQVGWYDSAYKYVRAFNVIPAFFTFALFPVISRQVQGALADARRTFRMSVKLLTLVALPLAAVTTLLAEVLIGLLGGTAFLPDGAVALRIMVWSIPFGWLNSVTNYVLIALGQERMQTRAFAIGVGFNLIANLIFLRLYGYRAAAVITIASEMVLLAVFHVYLVRKMPDVGWRRLLWKPALIAAVMLAVMALGAHFNLWLGLLAGVIVYPLGLFALRVFGPEERQILLSLLPRKL